ncbi:protein kintoun isoform X2 [Antechinus flavipes]|uniref:protein kintoun isoform X2 n=1 Tax=Antechinus flavipes TaxID=38775 RepID=UPI0022361418|nr:protein kintoun isoform X2 [Antechinus flavipes]
MTTGTRRFPFPPLLPTGSLRQLSKAVLSASPAKGLLRTSLCPQARGEFLPHVLIKNMASEKPDSLLQDLDLSAEEVKKLTNAFEDPEFRRLFGEYAAELSDPENRRRYEEEITALERERGVKVQFVHPEPGHVLRTSLNGAQRCFLNICSNPLLDQPSSQPSIGGPHGSSRGQLWSLPYSLAPGREYMGSQGARYKVYDIIFHPDTLSLGKRHERFRSMINATALEAVEKQFGVKLDRRNAKILKIKYKGTPEAAVLRTPLPGGPPPAPEGEESGDSPLPAFPYPYAYPDGAKASATQPHSYTPPREEPPDPAPTVPRHSIVQRHHVDLQDYRCSRDSCPSTVPRELVVTIELPLLRSAGQAVLEVTEKQLLLDSRKPDYSLHLPLPYPVEESRGSAQFNKAKRQLIVTLPVVPPKHSIEHLDLQVEEEVDVEEKAKEEKKKEEEDNKKEEEEKKKLKEEEKKKEKGEKEEGAAWGKGLQKQAGTEDLVKSLSSKGMPETDGSQSVCTSEEIGSQFDKLLRDTRMFKDWSQDISSDALVTFQSCPENSWTLSGKEMIDSQEGTMEDPAAGIVAVPLDTSELSLVTKANPPSCTREEDLLSETMILPGRSNEMPASGVLNVPRNAGPSGTSGQPLISKANLSNGTISKEPALPGGCNEVPSSGTLSFPGNTSSLEESKKKTNRKESFPENPNKVQPREAVFSETKRGKILCPPLQCNQDEESLILLIQVPQIQPQSLQSDLSPHQYKLCFSTQDVVSYSFILQFAPENKLSSKEPKINISSFNTVIEFAKSPESYGHWKKWYFGLSNNCLQERFFVIEENVDKFLEGVFNFEKPAPKTQPLIEVLEVSDKKTEIQLKSIDGEVEVQEVDGQNQHNEKEQRIKIRSHLTEKENKLQINTKSSNSKTDVEKEHTKGNIKPSDCYTADKALKKRSCGSALCLQHDPAGASTEVIGKFQQSDSMTKPVFTKEKIAIYSNNEKQNLKQPTLVEEKKPDKDHILQNIKETDMKDGSVQIIKEHVTDCAFTFQNSLLFDLD